MGKRARVLGVIRLRYNSEEGMQVEKGTERRNIISRELE